MIPKQLSLCVRVCFNRKLSHCKLVQLYGVCTQRSPMCLLFEFMGKGCLSEYLRATKGCLSQDTMLRMCLDVSEGMAYLEGSNFLHRDLVNRRTRTLYDTLLHLCSVSIFIPLCFSGCQELSCFKEQWGEGVWLWYDQVMLFTVGIFFTLYGSKQSQHLLTTVKLLCNGVCPLSAP